MSESAGLVWFGRLFFLWRWRPLIGLIMRFVQICQEDGGGVMCLLNGDCPINVNVDDFVNVEHFRHVPSNSVGIFRSFETFEVGIMCAL